MGGVAHYDMSKAPASWDFLQFLINAKLTFDGPFDVMFSKGPKHGFRDDTVERPLDQRQAIFDNVMRPALDMIGAREILYAEETVEVSYLPRVAVEAANNGRLVPQWTVPPSIIAECKAWLNGRHPIVITLREATYYPERNSNLDAWMTFARECGEDVIFVRDTAKADEPLDGFETCPRASKDLIFRTALTSLAKWNMLVANGPAILAFYMNVAWMMFRPLAPEYPDYLPGRPSWWRKNMGVKAGGQFPWASHDQKIIWGPDTIDVIREAWKNRNIREMPEIRSFSAWNEKVRFEHVKRNCARISHRLPDCRPPNGRTAILACYGPSLKDTWYVAANTMGDLFTVSGAHGFMLEHDVVPYGQIDCDPRPHKAAQFGKPHHDVRYWLGSCIHPDYLDRLKGHQVALWHLHNGEESAQNIWGLEPEAWLCVGGGSVGLRAISLLYAQGYRHFEIHGMDCSLADGQTYAGAHLGKKRDTVRVRCGDRWFESNLSLIDYARQFLDDLRLWPGATFQMFGDGLLQHMIETREKIG